MLGWGYIHAASDMQSRSLQQENTKGICSSLGFGTVDSTKHILCAKGSADGGCHHLTTRKGGSCKDASSRIRVCPIASCRPSWDHS